MNRREQARRDAMAFLAAYEGEDRHEADRRLARIARGWLSILRVRGPVMGIVDRLMDELYEEPAADVGCGWEDLRRKFTAWALAEEWIDPQDRRLTGASPAPAPRKTHPATRKRRSP